jgi:hypothetical protein
MERVLVSGIHSKIIVPADLLSQRRLHFHFARPPRAKHAVPELRPALRAVAEHLGRGGLPEPFLGPSAVHAEDDAPGLGREEAGEGGCELVLLVFGEEVEEGDGEDGGDTAAERVERSEAFQVWQWLVWPGRGGGGGEVQYGREEVRVEDVAFDKVGWVRFGRRTEEPMPEVPES